MKLSYITFMVRDMKKTVDFYEKVAGLHVIRQFNPGKGEITFMANSADEIMLEFIQFENVEKVSVKGMVMSFKAEEDLECLRERTIELGCDPTDIIEEGPKPKYFRVNDPDGMVIEFSI